ncbi:hypothetical protein QVD17_14724 [Tagetes erecta]|uniref:Reverse transcriptase zinc-binding domain-containing protein n=1 Tax=Tagetes erecta TaxID=13708 RepID=A0AAD8KRV3_TARER|nr:hypothetical protein QVD17_14724 [Tagetes erecta]
MHALDMFQEKMNENYVWKLFTIGVVIPSLECSLCFGTTETPFHVLRECPFAAQVWKEIHKWCGYQLALDLPLKNSLDSITHLNEKTDLRNALYSILLATLWFIWKTRNEFIFSTKRVAVNKVVDEIKFNTFAWMKKRAKLENLVWHTWCSFSFRNFPL